MQQYRAFSVGAAILRVGRDLRNYLGLGALKRTLNLTGRASLADFIDSRASHVAQTSLYGYLRTRAGTRYPELFEDTAFSQSINIAKWQIYLACYSDLCIYTGCVMTKIRPDRSMAVSTLLDTLSDSHFAGLGVPPDAGGAFTQGVAAVRERVLRKDFSANAESGDTVFVASPQSLVDWAPVIDEFKTMDEEIIRNSVRFRWHEVQRELRGAMTEDLVDKLINSETSL